MSDQVKYCSQCGATNTPSAVVCRACGNMSFSETALPHTDVPTPRKGVLRPTLSILTVVLLGALALRAASTIFTFVQSILDLPDITSYSYGDSSVTLALVLAFAIVLALLALYIMSFVGIASHYSKAAASPGKAPRVVTWGPKLGAATVILDMIGAFVIVGAYTWIAGYLSRVTATSYYGYYYGYYYHPSYTYNANYPVIVTGLIIDVVLLGLLSAEYRRESRVGQHAAGELPAPAPLTQTQGPPSVWSKIGMSVGLGAIAVFLTLLTLSLMSLDGISAGIILLIAALAAWVGAFWPWVGTRITEAYQNRREILQEQHAAGRLSTPAATARHAAPSGYVRPQFRFCRSCGTSISAEDLFCTRCGTQTADSV